MERWEAKYESSDGQQATCSRTLFGVPGAIAVCSGCAKKDCASFKSVCHKDDEGDENLFVVSDDDTASTDKQIKIHILNR